MSWTNEGSGSQAEADACKLVMHVAANMDNPGIMGILRKSPRPESGNVSAPGQGAAELGRSRGQAGPGTQPVQAMALEGLVVLKESTAQDIGLWEFRTG